MGFFSEKMSKWIGPGFLVAATGVGAGDLVAASVAGANYGMAIAWAIFIGAALKYALNEGLARWQLATGLTLFEGWVQYFGKWVQYYFLVYLVFWSFSVGAALMVACGLAANTLFPALSITQWAIFHSVVAAIFVSIGGYSYFEKIMGIFTGLMFFAFISCAFYVHPPYASLYESFAQMSIPKGSAKTLLGVIGGVGGSLTLLSYGYWIREKNWKTPEHLKTIRQDLFVGYALTGLFCYSLVVLASSVLHAQGLTFQKEGDKILQMAMMLQSQMGVFGFYLFILGFWAAVATSLLGVWQSVPTLFCDFVSVAKKVTPEKREQILSISSVWYRSYLVYIAFAPISLLLMNKEQEPFYIIVFYTLVGSFFMPFLAGTLLIMNSKSSWIGEKYRYSIGSQLFLLLCLVLFGYLCFTELQDVIKKAM